eukprot:TRINITY_DN5941_c0_g5_i1.p1 TRINITY_DN5941_c0_g5~~TRINITY_DN5941_c0_g5_i1.p1  ORF type:complete len:1087 (-),score=310.40 TRINITY_DN5941_c0_g5_i1:60-3320(-)
MDQMEDEINCDELLDFRCEEALVTQAQVAWKAWVEKSTSKEAAAAALYTSIVEAVNPNSKNQFFVNPKAVASMHFLEGIEDLIMHAHKNKDLMARIEVFAFKHLQMDLTPGLIIAFRDACIRVIDMDLNGKLSTNAHGGLRMIFNYVGGAFIFTKQNYAERLRLLADSWAEASAMGAGDEEADHHGSGVHNGPPGGQDQEEDGGDGKETGEHDSKKETIGQGQAMPTTFQDMFTMNAAVMGLANIAWMNNIIDNFDIIVNHCTNANRLQEVCDVLSLNLAFFAEEEIQLGEFKTCMLAALRSLLPKVWTPQHEVAWEWLWASFSKMLQANLGRPSVQARALHDFLEQIDEETGSQIRTNYYHRFFEVAPVGQEYFKQSNTRLHFIADLIFKLAEEIYGEPNKSVKEISALGLRHVGFGIPTDLFGPFVTSVLESIDPFVEDRMALEGFRWALGLISRILVRTILEGSTVVMKSINANSVKQLKLAIQAAPRGQRASWLLLVQVGAQSISPLAWAIESGKLEVARTILEDLLTMRSDRESYYFGNTDLFKRHPDIVKKICLEAPMLVTTLLDGLIWRSHRPKNNMRRVNYYIEHVLVTILKQEFSDGLQYICGLSDPQIMAHPLVVVVSDSLWIGIVYRQFLQTKCLNLISLIVFILALSVLPRLETENTQIVNVFIFVGKLFTYVLGMGRLGFTHLITIYVWSRKELKRIFEEIDQDGNGDIDYEEFMEAMGMFKELIAEKVRGALSVFTDDGKVVLVDESKAKGGNKKGSSSIGILLFLTLVCMCVKEPMLLCSDQPDFPTNHCQEATDNAWIYSLFTMMCMGVHWLVIIDLSVFSTSLSAFLLVIGHVLKEVRQFIIALMFLLLMFGSSISILCRRCTNEGGDFHDMTNSMTSLLAITVRLYQGDFRDMAENPLLLAAVLLCTTLTAVLLLNLLVAQLNLSYEFVYRDVEGFARLNRATLIVEAMNFCSKSRWNKFKANCKFDQKLEFDEGDVGLPGGIQMQEPASLNRVTEEAIQRFGGTTSREAPWPTSQADALGDDRFERVEILLDRVIKQVSDKGRFGNKGRTSMLEASDESGMEEAGDE